MPTPTKMASDGFYDAERRAACLEARAMVTNFGGGLLLTRSALDLQAGVTIIPAAIFTWLLDQRG